MIVIFMSEEAKTCNTIFSRTKTKDELSVKCINIFDLNTWATLGANSTFILGTGCLGKRESAASQPGSEGQPDVTARPPPACAAQLLSPLVGLLAPLKEGELGGRILGPPREWLQG